MNLVWHKTAIWNDHTGRNLKCHTSFEEATQLVYVQHLQHHIGMQSDPKCMIMVIKTQGFHQFSAEQYNVIFHNNTFDLTKTRNLRHYICTDDKVMAVLCTVCYYPLS